MPGLGEAYGDGSTETGNLVRLGLGYGLVVGGGALFAAGLLRVVGDATALLGIPAPIASRLALTLALLVVPFALIGLRTRLRGEAGAVPLAAGAGLVVIAVVGAWATSTGSSGIGGVALPVLLAYGIGLLLLSAGVLAGPIAAGGATGRTVGTGASVGFQRSTGTSRPGVTPADGGRDVDEDLEFPLDDE